MHSEFMQEAILIALKARYIAPPNPWVGCVVVKNNQIIGTGYTQQPGHFHAEMCALQEAQGHARGAVMYVSLEPCSHFGRTPPCTNAIIQSGIAEIFIAQLDPDTRVQGKGVSLLKEAGIKVHLGLCEQEAKNNLLPYLYQRTTGMPYTVLKSAISMDGKIATKEGTSQWITSEQAREDAHLLRADSQAIVIGSGTAIKDTPRLTVRHKDILLPKQPLRVILDTSGRLKPSGFLFDTAEAPTLIMTSEKCPSATRKQWTDAGVESVVVPHSNSRIDLLEAWKILGKRGILQALVEGGSNLQSELLKTDLVNRLILYVGPLLLGSEGIPLFNGQITNLSLAPRFTLQFVKQLENDIRLDYFFTAPSLHREL